MFASRNRAWKLVLGNGSGGRQEPKGKPFSSSYQLFDLNSDLSESVDVYTKYPKIARKMLSAFDKIYMRTELEIKHEIPK